MTEEKKKKYKDYTLEEIITELDELDKQLGRQHGRMGIKCEDSEKEKKRLWNNLQSRKSRMLKQKIEKERDKHVNEILKLHEDEDEFGIRPVDERRYTKCFHSGYIGETPERKYVQIMTGLSLKQINILQKRTGLVPNPAVNDSEADADEKRRWETGDYL